MKKTSQILAGALVLALASTAFAQPYPNNGYVGVYADAAGTQCCITVPQFASTTVHVIAKLGGATSSGVTGVEFRLEFSAAAGYFLTFNPGAGASVVLGNPIDDNPAANDQGKGLNIAWPSCVPDPIGPQFSVGTITVFNVSGGPCEIKTKRHEAASSPEHRCPLFILCDAPVYTKADMTITEEQNGGIEPIAFVSQMNVAGCAPTNCGPVAVEPATWSTVKDLYR
jgi:hypothetical protein